MSPRIDFSAVNPGVFKAMVALQTHVETSKMDRHIVDLVKIRSSQINGCAYCIDMHTKDARAHGETEQRIYGLDAWEECPYYTERERAALAWTEAVTQVADGHVPDAVYATAREQFSEESLVDLTLAVVAINGWNRLCVAFRAVPGTYRSPRGTVSTPAAAH